MNAALCGNLSASVPWGMVSEAEKPFDYETNTGVASGALRMMEHVRVRESLPSSPSTSHPCLRGKVRKKAKVFIDDFVPC